MGTRWRVGNGRSINVKNDRWIPQPLIFKVVTPNEELWNMQVTEFIEPGVGWRVVLLQAHLASWILRLKIFSLSIFQYMIVMIDSFGIVIRMRGIQ